MVKIVKLRADGRLVRPSPRAKGSAKNERIKNITRVGDAQYRSFSGIVASSQTLLM